VLAGVNHAYLASKGRGRFSPNPFTEMEYEMSDEYEVSGETEVTTPQTKPRAPRPPTAVGVQIWDEDESRWDDLGGVHEDGVITVFDSTAEARQFMKDE